MYEPLYLQCLYFADGINLAVFGIDFVSETYKKYIRFCKAFSVQCRKIKRKCIHRHQNRESCKNKALYRIDKLPENVIHV